MVTREYELVNVVIDDGAPTEEYITATASIWVTPQSYITGRGTARSRAKAIAFALINLADSIKDKERYGHV